MGFVDFLALTLVVAAVVAIAILQRGKISPFGRVVYEWQTGLLYLNGKFEREVGPGRYWLWFNRSLFTVPRIEQTLLVSGQDVLSKDRLQFRITGLITYVISDPRLFLEQSGGLVDEGLKTDLQLALREIAASRPLEELIDDRKALDGELLAIIAPKALTRGVRVTGAAIRDLMLGAETRRLYAEFERARLEGLASLERARGEQAALRSLANSARLLKGNPELMNIRLLHALAGQPGKQPPTIVLGGAAGLLPVTSAAKEADPPSAE